jgi:hypothetical protein
MMPPKHSLKIARNAIGLRNAFDAHLIPIQRSLASDQVAQVPAKVFFSAVAGYKGGAEVNVDK